MPTSATIFVSPWRKLVTATDERVWGRCRYRDAHWSVVHSEWGDPPKRTVAVSCRLCPLHSPWNIFTAECSRGRFQECPLLSRLLEAEQSDRIRPCFLWVLSNRIVWQSTAVHCPVLHTNRATWDFYKRASCILQILFHFFPLRRKTPKYFSVSKSVRTACCYSAEGAKNTFFLLFCMALKQCSKSGLDSPLLLIRSVLIVAHFSSFNFQLPSQEPTSLLLAWTSVLRGRKQVDLQDEKTS